MGRGEEEELDREQEGIKENQDGVRGNPPPPLAHPTHVVTVREPQRIDWATDIDLSISPVPSARDFCPALPSQPIHALLEPTITPQKHDMAPCARTPTMDAPTTPHACDLRSNQRGHVTTSKHRACTSASVVPCACTPGSPIKYPAPVTAPPQVPAERTPTAIVHGLHDLSALRSDAPNPWGSLRCRRSGQYAHAPHQFTHQRRCPVSCEYIFTHPSYARTTSSCFRNNPTPIRNQANQTSYQSACKDGNGHIHTFHTIRSGYCEVSTFFAPRCICSLLLWTISFQLR
jgi:hypothetical protein